jgi:hypothetical protein
VIGKNLKVLPFKEVVKAVLLEIVKEPCEYEEGGVILISIVALEDLAERAVYPIVLAIDATEFRFTAESRNASLAD